MLLQKVWEVIKAILKYEGNSSYTSLWYNMSLQDLAKLEIFDHWLSRGIMYLHKILELNALKSFQQLQDEYGLLKVCFYQYLQLRHALHAQ